MRFTFASVFYLKNRRRRPSQRWKRCPGQQLAAPPKQHPGRPLIPLIHLMHCLPAAAAKPHREAKTWQAAAAVLAEVGDMEEGRAHIEHAKVLIAISRYVSVLTQVYPR